MSVPVLFHLPYSPWSERARWALDHHRVVYAKRLHKPMVGEPALRLATRRPIGRVSVPTLIDGGRVFDDSFTIAEHAERIGRGAPLFPAALHGEIRTWNAISEAALAAGRAASLRRALSSPSALEEGLEGVVPGPLRPYMRGVAKSAIIFLERKYHTEQAATRALSEGLDRLRRALEVNGGTVLAQRTYADYTMAVVLQFVAPVANTHLAIGDGTRAVLGDPELAARYADLVAWRDALYRDARRG